jgi:hypothetical protein
MSSTNSKILLIGDNPFHGVNHLSQEYSRNSDVESQNITRFAEVVNTSLQNGANGFMFSVSRVTLSILRELGRKNPENELSAYAIVPYAYEYVRLATQKGGISGLGKKMAKEVLLSGQIKTMYFGLKGFAFMDITSLLKTYVLYEIHRIKSTNKNIHLKSVLMHEILTEMGLALDLDFLFKDFISFMKKQGMSPGFETRNFVFLVDKFKKWGIPFEGLTIATPFNSMGFQMNPSREECEKALVETKDAQVIGMSILSSGYLKPDKAVEYLKTLPNLSGVVVGVSKEKHAHETFRFLSGKLS